MSSKMISKEELEKMIEEINNDLDGMELQPLNFVDDGWRYYVDGPELDDAYDALEGNLENVPGLEKFLDLAIYDMDGQGFYYWVPYDQPPRGVTTPAMRFMALK